MKQAEKRISRARLSKKRFSEEVDGVKVVNEEVDRISCGDAVDNEFGIVSTP